MSRFLYQLKYDSNYKIKEKNLVSDISLSVPEPIVIEKNLSIQNSLNEYISSSSKKYLSPSAIISYIDCSLKFYFKNIAKIKEPKEISETIDPPTFGNIFHNTMFMLYSSFKGKEITTNDFENLLSNKILIDESLKKSFAEDFYKTTESENTEITGRNILIFEILKKYIIATIKIDKKNAPIKIIDLEGFYSKKFNFQINNKEYTIKIGGIIDRIDSINNKIRIIDYKTGKDKLDAPKLEHLFDSEKKNKALLQLLIYLDIYKTENTNNLPIEIGLYLVKSVFESKAKYRFEHKKNKQTEFIDESIDYISFFNAEFSNLLSEIFNKDIAFSQTENVKLCEYCTYKEICGK